MFKKNNKFYLTNCWSISRAAFFWEALGDMKNSKLNNKIKCLGTNLHQVTEYYAFRGLRDIVYIKKNKTTSYYINNTGRY